MPIIFKIFNEGFAWLSFILGLTLASTFIIRICIQKNTKCMKSIEKILGILLILTGTIHGIFSGGLVTSLTGTICWIVSILIGLNYISRKLLKKQGNWIKYHRILTILFLLTLVLHLVDVKVFL